MTTVYIDRGFPAAKVHFDYDPEVVQIVKSIPGKAWHKTERHWTIPDISVDRLVMALEWQGEHQAIVVEAPQPKRDTMGDWALREVENLHREIRRLKQDNERLMREAAAQRHDWALQLLDTAGPELGERVFKRLTGVLHPDAGGNNELMRDLNVARDHLMATR